MDDIFHTSYMVLAQAEWFLVVGFKIWRRFLRLSVIINANAIKSVFCTQKNNTSGPCRIGYDRQDLHEKQYRTASYWLIEMSHRGARRLFPLREKNVKCSLIFNNKRRWPIAQVSMSLFGCHAYRARLRLGAAYRQEWLRLVCGSSISPDCSFVVGVRSTWPNFVSK